MELRQIRYFIAVAEEGNFSSAARRLYVSQPPITRQIQQLEAELEVQLFERTQKGVVLTPAGDAFLDEARQILTRTKLAKERSQAAGKGEIGNLEIGYFGSPIYSIIPQVIRNLRQEYQHISVSLQQLTKKEQVESIKDGRIHVGFSRYYQHDDHLKVKTVAQEKILLALSSAHPLASAKKVSLKQLKDECLIVFPKNDRPSFADEVVRILRKTGFEPHIDHEAADLSSALALTAAGMGVCPVPESVAHLQWPNVTFLDIQGVSTTSPVNCVYAATNQSPILLKFLDTLTEAL